MRFDLYPWTQIGPDASRSGAARIVPYSSRLLVEGWQRKRRLHADKEEEEKKEEDGSDSGGGNGGGTRLDRITVSYNGLALLTMEGGLAEWRERYAAALQVRCVTDGQGGTGCR